MRRGAAVFFVCLCCFNLQVCRVHRSQIVFLTDYSYYYIPGTPVASMFPYSVQISKKILLHLPGLFRRNRKTVKLVCNLLFTCKLKRKIMLTTQKLTAICQNNTPSS